MNLRGLLAVELKRVADQVLEKLPDLTGVHRQGGQGIVGSGGLSRVNARLQVAQGPPERVLQVGGQEGVPAHGDARKSEQIADEPLHAGGAVEGAGNVIPGLGIQLVREAVLEELDVTADGPQWL